MRQDWNKKLLTGRGEWGTASSDELIPEYWFGQPERDFRYIPTQAIIPRQPIYDPEHSVIRSKPLKAMRSPYPYLCASIF